MQTNGVFTVLRINTCFILSPQTLVWKVPEPVLSTISIKQELQ